jgi:hypothetical protein
MAHNRWGGQKFPNIFEISLIGFVGPTAPYFLFVDFWGDHFVWVESSRDENLTMYIMHFHIFLVHV